MSGEAGLRRLARNLRMLEFRAHNLLPVWPRVGNHIARTNLRIFITRGASAGRPWKPLAASTVAAKLRSGRRQPLVGTGHLKRELTGRPMGVEQYRGQSATFGTNYIVAVWQQGGTRRHGRRHIPPRVLMKLNVSDRKEIKKLIAKYVLKDLD